MIFRTVETDRNCANIFTQNNLKALRREILFHFLFTHKYISIFHFNSLAVVWED